MAIKPKLSLPPRHRLNLFILAVLLLGLFCVSLSAQPRVRQLRDIPPVEPTESITPSQAESQTLLPAIPPISTPLPGTFGSSPSTQVPDPDEFKTVYGYSGPYYNTADLDGRVTVLDQSLHTWSTPSWKISGLLRNQTRSPIRIAKVTARLLGAHSELLETAAAVVPVEILRPGEPAPFVVAAQLSGTLVKAVDWHIDYFPATTTSRQFELSVFSEQTSSEYGYYLFGRIRNAEVIDISSRIVAAWLDKQGHGRVLYVDTPKIAFVTTTPELADFRGAVTLPAGHFENFVYRNKDPAFSELVTDATLVLWGVSQ